MTFIPVTNAADFSLQFAQQSGDFAENVFGVQRDEAWTVPALTTVGNAIMEWWKSGDGTHKYQGLMSSTVTLLGCYVRDMTTAISPTLSLPVPGDITAAGAGSANPLPQGVSFAVTARTGLAGRSYRGRTFLIGLTEDDIVEPNANQLPAASATGIVAAFNALITAVHTADSHSTLVVVSKYSGVDSHGKPIPRTVGVTTPIIGYGYHDLFLDYQRRRAPGHNRHH